jgi:hypothetical protein
MIDAVTAVALAPTEEFQRLGSAPRGVGEDAPADYLFAVENEPHLPDEIFWKLRWGGQLVYISRHRRKVAELAPVLEERGFNVLQGPARTGWWWPFSGVYYLTARRVLLIPPRQITDRFSYHVHLVPSDEPDGQPVVLKEVPSVERVMARLRSKTSSLSNAVLEKRARKFTEKIFPVFLTREAAILQILHRDLPHPYNTKVPRVLKMEKDSRGFVRKLWMTWLRNGGKPLSQLEYARQSADMLRVLHEEAEIMHLDLRLDNMVITPDGVGFVDFGSAVRIGENIGQSPLLSTLFGELMRTSQIQRMLDQMTSTGEVTSKTLEQARHKVDPGVDLFYLAVQISAPRGKPELAGLVDYDPESPTAEALNQLTQAILKPEDPQHPPYATARQILEGIDRIAQNGGEPMPVGQLEGIFLEEIS